MQTLVIQEEPLNETASTTVVSATGIIRRSVEGDTCVKGAPRCLAHVASGKLTAVMGPSRSGKSTLMHRHESIVTALIGAAFGIAVGIFLAGLTSLALSEYGIVFAIRYGSLAAFVAVAILAGMLAAILPARRASRLNVLKALQYE
jgi:hypothetical protein